MSSEFPTEDRSAFEGKSSSHRSRGGSSAVFALILIAIGGFFLADNLGLLGAFGDLVPANFNWWALFILIPIAGIGSRLWDGLQASDGRVIPAMRGQVVGLLVLIVVFGALAFDLDWGKIWPFFLIAAGLGSLLVAMTND